MGRHARRLAGRRRDRAVRVRLDLRPLLPDLLRDSTGPCLEGWVTTTALAQATTPAAGRRARHRACRTATPRCSPTWRRRSTSSPADGSSSASARAGTRRRRRAYGIDLHATLTERFDAFDEGCEAIIGLLTQRARPRSTVATCSSPTRAASRSRSSSRTRRSASVAAASAARCGRWRGSRSTGTSPAARRTVRREARRAARALRGDRARPVRDHDVDASPPRRRTVTSAALVAHRRAVRRGRSRPRHRLPPAAAHPGGAGTGCRGIGVARRLTTATVPA